MEMAGAGECVIKAAKCEELTRAAGTAGLKQERSGPDWAAGPFNTTHRLRNTALKTVGNYKRYGAEGVLNL